MLRAAAATGRTGCARPVRALARHRRACRANYRGAARPRQARRRLGVGAGGRRTRAKPTIHWCLAVDGCCGSKATRRNCCSRPITSRWRAAALSLGGSIVVSMHAARAPRAVQLILQQRQKVNQTVFSLSPDMSTLAIARKAIENVIPVYSQAPRGKPDQLGQGRYGRMAWETVIDPQSLTRCASRATSRHDLLACPRPGLPTLPSSRLVDNADHAVEVAQELGPPVVIKPSSGGKGNQDQPQPEGRRSRTSAAAFAIAARYPR